MAKYQKFQFFHKIISLKKRSLHDIGLVDNSDLLSSCKIGILKRVLSNPRGLLLSDNLQRFENSWVNLVLNSAILSFQVIPDDNEIDILVSRRNIRVISDIHN